MSGIALYLKDKGIKVSGSNNEYNSNIKKLEDNNIKVYIGHYKENITNPDLVIYSKAISDTNPELIAAIDNKIPLMERSMFIGLMTKEFNSICVSGTHGKSTTSSMISLCFINSGKNPTIQLGAILKNINSNYRNGNSNYFILEACEYKDQFLNFYPNTEVILNIDDDHLDYFKTIDNVKKSFINYVKKLDQDGMLVTNADDKSCTKLTHYNKGKTLTFGIDNACDYQATNIIFDKDGCASFDVNDNHITLKVKGKHNIYNALACYAICDYYNIPKHLIVYNLSLFSGAKRRFELLGTIKNNVQIYDDYAHHPTEIRATLDSVKMTTHHENWAIFEAHTYSRLHEHLSDFANVLKEFDHIIVAPIYVAREENHYNVKEKDLIKLIKPFNNNIRYINNYDKIVKYLKRKVKDNDLIVSIGAGKINEVCYKLLSCK